MTARRNKTEAGAQRCKEQSKLSGDIPFGIATELQKAKLQQRRQ
jgi:hypothetical protein